MCVCVYVPEYGSLQGNQSAFIRYWLGGGDDGDGVHVYHACLFGGLHHDKQVFVVPFTSRSTTFVHVPSVAPVLQKIARIVRIPA